MNWLKQYWGWILASIILLGLSFFQHDSTWLIILGYVLAIRLLLMDFIRGKLRKSLSILIWVLFAVNIVLTIYVNYYLPHGPSYPTGDIVCENDDRGPCGEAYKEDLTNLNIPPWAKFMRSNTEVLFFAFLIAGIAISNKEK
jgi:hypothetical protein